jgi:hypothetical protein
MLVEAAKELYLDYLKYREKSSRNVSFDRSSMNPYNTSTHIKITPAHFESDNSSVNEKKAKCKC